MSHLHPEDELVQLLRKMLPPGSCEKVLPPLLAICRGRGELPDVAHLVGELEHHHFHHPDSDPPYYWDRYYADD